MENPIEEKKRLKEELVKRSKEELEFPDEVDVPLDKSAITLFQKYRGLKSFKYSKWDCNENLPVDYGNIWKFQNINKI